MNAPWIGNKTGKDRKQTIGPRRRRIAGVAAAVMLSAAVVGCVVPPPPPPTDPTRPSAGCGAALPAPVEGVRFSLAIASAGVNRSFLSYVPTQYDGVNPLPLVVDLHGFSNSAATQATWARLDLAADTHGFVNVTPQGTGNPAFWNAGPLPQAPDDVQFISDLIDAADAQLCVDLARVYISGFSNGAMLASLTACELSDKVAAIAPVAGFMRPTNCAPARAVPIIAFHGTADALIRHESSTPGELRHLLPFNATNQPYFDAVNFQAMPDALSQWAAIQGCDPTVSNEPVTTNVSRRRYTGCAGGSTVELFTVGGGGHSWPGSQVMSAINNPLVGSTTMEIDATELMWEFFAQHHLPVP